MADLASQIGEARKSGHSDNDILGYLSKSRPDLAPKIKEAQGSGHSPGDILGYLSKVPQKTAKPALSNDPRVMAGENVKGMLKGAGSTALGVGESIDKVIGATTGVKDWLLSPQDVTSAAEFLKPSNPQQARGKAIEQGLEYFVPVPGGAKLKALKGAGGVAARVGAEALKSGLIGGAQTRSLRGAGESAALGAVGGALAEGAAALKPKAARAAYQSALRPGAKPTLAQRTEMVERGLKPGAELPVAEKSLPKLQTEIDKHKNLVQTITKDPGSPYAGRSIPVKDLLAPVDDYIKRVDRVDSSLARTLGRKRADWAKALGGGADATVQQAQRLKEDLYAVINSSAYAEGAEPGVVTAGRKLAARGMKRGIENVIPEEPVREINHVIENDIRLKDAITHAVKTHPSWVNDWAVFVLGSGIGEAIAGGEKLGGAAAVGALARMAARNPNIMSRLAIALQRVGVPSGQFLPAAQAAGR